MLILLAQPTADLPAPLFEAREQSLVRVFDDHGVLDAERALLQTTQASQLELLLLLDLVEKGDRLGWHQLADLDADQLRVAAIDRHAVE